LIVVDASAAVEMLLNTSAGEACSEAAEAGRPTLVPGHFDAEVYNAIRRAFLERRIDRAALGTLIDQLSRFDAERVALAPFLPNVVQLVDVIGAHDVFYVLLAISRTCPLLTCDMRLARAASRLGIEVVAIDRSHLA
jgi:predicted nucleic acid-binding protein